MKKSESIAGLAKALAAFQAEVKQPMKDKENPFFKSKYVPLESVAEAINDCGPKHGLSFTQWPSVSENGRIGVTTLLMHSSGEWIEYDPIYMKSEKDTAQGAGSVITYLKRYSLSAVYGITSDEDDDGNAASEPKGKQAAPPSDNLITAAQMKALGTKVGNVAKANGQEAPAVYDSAVKHFGINKQSKELTKAEASKIIDYLAKLEG